MENNPTPRDSEQQLPYFHYPISEVIKLAKPVILPTTSLADIVVNRRSRRSFRKISIEELGDILWMSAKTREIVLNTNGYILSFRPSASAGARHPIDIIVFYKSNIFECYYYNPFEHSLNKLNLNKSVEAFVEHINSVVKVDDGAVIWFIAHPSRTESKYLNATSLIWRDAGTLIHSVQIACTTWSFNSCPIGSLGEPYISDLFADSGVVVSAGGLIVGC